MKPIVFIALILISIIALSGCPQQPDCDGHAFGETWPAEDGCNTCTCTETGIGCTEMACLLEGNCVDAGDCEAQGLPHVECEGEWKCAEKKCAWECMEEETMTEIEAREASERYVRAMQQYKESEGINLKVSSAAKGDCGDCWTIELEFDFLKDENAEELSKAFAVLWLEDGKVKEHAISMTGFKEVRKGDSIKVHYKGTLDDGTEFDSSLDRGPLEFKAGMGGMISGFDAAVLGMEIGEEKNARLEPGEAYGEHDPALVRVVRREQVEIGVELKPGMMIGLSQPDGTQIPVTITEVSDELVTLDLNPQMAGKTLNFWIKIVEIGK